MMRVGIIDLIRMVSILILQVVILHELESRGQAWGINRVVSGGGLTA